MALLFKRLLGLLEDDCIGFVRQADVEPLPAIELGEVILGNRSALGELARTAIDHFLDQQLFDPVKRIVFNDAQLVVKVLAIAAKLVVDDRLRALVADDPFACEDLHVDDRADHARRHAQRGVLDVRSLLAKDRAQKLFFRRQLGFALGRHLADQHVIGAHFRANVHDARVIQTVKLRFRQVADVARDYFGPELRIACNDREFLDVDRGVAIVSDNLFRNQDRVFEVVAVPRHKGDQHVLAERELAQVSRRTVGKHVARSHQIAAAHDRALVDVGVLVRAGVLDQVVDVDTDFAGDVFFVIDANHDAIGVDVVDHAATQGLNGRPGVDRDSALNTSTDDGLFRTQARHGLTLHVGAHQRAVCVIVLEERDERSGDGNDL